MKKIKTWGPGYRYFECEECGNQWKEATRDCTSHSSEACELCYDVCAPIYFEPHNEWETDLSGKKVRR